MSRWSESWIIKTPWSIFVAWGVYDIAAPINRHGSAAFSGTIRPPQTLVGKAAGPKSAKSSILQILLSTTGVRWLFHSASPTQEVFHFPNRPGKQVWTGVGTTLEFHAWYLRKIKSCSIDSFFVRRSFRSNFSGLAWESECFWVKPRFQDIFRSLPGCPWARCSLVLTTLPQCFQVFAVESHILLKPVWKMSLLLFSVFLPLQFWWTQTPSDPWPTPLCCSDPEDRSARPTLRAGTHYA